MSPRQSCTFSLRVANIIHSIVSPTQLCQQKKKKKKKGVYARPSRSKNRVIPKLRRIPQHFRDNQKPYITPHTFSKCETRSPIAGGHYNIFELRVAIVFRLDEVSAVDLAVREFDGNEVALRFMEEFDGDARWMSSERNSIGRSSSKSA